MARLFGTDGVRGIANQELTCELAFQLGQASATVLASQVRRPTLLVGRDTRVSGDMLEAALVAGICSVGAQAVLVGVLPTPGIAYLTHLYEADAGVVISASHNGVAYNGIKFFDRAGFKLPDAVEDQIEALIRDGLDRLRMPIGAAVGRPVRQLNAQRAYTKFLIGTTMQRFDGLHVVLDCAHGASSMIAPEVFQSLGATVTAFYHEPDGTNINEHCGSTHPQRLQERVCELGADVGLAFDGDADRLIAVDERGRLVDGDVIMAICAIHLQQVGKLAQDTLVTTVMSNVGLDIAMKQHGIRVEKTDVGDRYVLERMREKGYMLGGEQSGHMIFLAHQTTGDGMLTGVELLSILTETGRSLGNLAQCMQALPQALLGAKVPESHKMTFREDAEIARAVDLLEKKYAESGRVLIRPSGTEPLVRVMIEGPDLRMIEQDAFELAQLIETRMA